MYADEGNRNAGVVGAARGWKKQLLAREGLSIRERTVSGTGRQVGVIQVVQHLGLGLVDPAQGQGPGPGVQDKTGMEFVGRGEVGRAVSEDYFELAGIDEGIGGEGPLSQVRVVVGQEQPSQRDGVGGGVINFQPGGGLPRPVGDAVEMERFHLVEPQWREGGQGGKNGIGGPRGRAGQDRGRADFQVGQTVNLAAGGRAPGQANQQLIPAGARQVPVAQGVGSVGHDGRGVLPDGIGNGVAVAGCDDVQAGAA